MLSNSHKAGNIKEKLSISPQTGLYYSLLDSVMLPINFLVQITIMDRSAYLESKSIRTWLQRPSAFKWSNLLSFIQYILTCWEFKGHYECVNESPWLQTPKLYKINEVMTTTISWQCTIDTENGYLPHRRIVWDFTNHLRNRIIKKNQGIASRLTKTKYPSTQQEQWSRKIKSLSFSVLMRGSTFTSRYAHFKPTGIDTYDIWTSWVRCCTWSFP